MNERVAIACICDDQYVTPTVVAITSIIANKNQETLLDIFIVTADLSEQNSRLFKSFLSETVGITVINETVKDLHSQYSYNTGKSCVATTAALLKFKLPYLVGSHEKLLYIDGDIIVREDLSALFNTNIDDFPIAAVIDSGSLYYRHKYVARVKDYFNSGVMLMNIKMMREERMPEKLLAKKGELRDSLLMDQDAFNTLFDGKVKLLPIRYNLLYPSLRRIASKVNIQQINERYGSQYNSYEDMKKDAAIIHFASKDKPWIIASLPFADEWYHYFLAAKDKYSETLPNNDIRKIHQYIPNAEQPKVSVIMPVYNVEAYITESLHSIMRQTLTDLQIICVNDGSTDCTMEMLIKLAAEDPRVIVVEQQNQGQSAARNKGVTIATGEYVYFFDSDDILVDNALELLYIQAKQTLSQIVLFDGVTFFDNADLAQSHSKYTNMYQRSCDYPNVYTGTSMYELMVNNNDFKVSVCLQFFNHQYLQENHLLFMNGIIHEDVLFSYQAMLLCQRVTHLRRDLYLRRIRPDSIMTTEVSLKNFMGYYICLIEMLSFAISHQSIISKTTLLPIIKQMKTVKSLATHIYQGLPQNDKKEPQFLQPVQHLIASVMYQPSELFQPCKNNNNNKNSNNSREYRIGYVIMYIPRKVKSLITRLKQDGFIRTLKYAIRLAVKK